MIYLDNAATMWPKPPGVAEAMCEFIKNVGANPGRAAHHNAIESGRLIYRTRESIARVFGAPDPMRVVFGANITEALNLTIHGLLKPGDHVVTTGMEHNAVMRPLRYVESQGIELTVVPCTPEGLVASEAIRQAIRSNTRLVIVNHASNVVGTIQPIDEIGQIVRSTQALFVVDTAQTAGSVPIDMQTSSIDLLAFTGHKALCGPMGTGGLVIGPRVDIDEFEPLKRGGTGSRSEEEFQPTRCPDKYESGTLNVVGLAGLVAGIDWLLDRGIDSIRAHEMQLTQLLIQGLYDMPYIQVYGTHDATCQTATVSFNIVNMPCSEVGLRLDTEFGIACRVGLHCSPAAHHTMGTFPEGTVRLGMSALTTEQEILETLNAVRSLAQEASRR